MARRNFQDYKLVFDELTEEKIQKEGQDGERQRKDKTDAFCDDCFVRNVIYLRKNVAFYLCYLCEQYLCDNCFKGHESHNYIKLVSEKSEIEGQIESFLDEMMNECEREKKFEREKVSVVDRVYVEKGLFQCQDCVITGLCGLNNTRWVACDYANGYIKLFCVGSNLLQRSLRLKSCRPWHVTEIRVKNEPTEPVVKTTSDISVMNRAEPLPSLLAVTSPWNHRLLIIDVTQNPAVITKCITTEKPCWSIAFSGDNIFTLCLDADLTGGIFRWVLCVMSTDGVTIQTVDMGFLQRDRSFPSLAICPGSIYITEPYKKRVLRLNDAGHLVSLKSIEGSVPLDISVDPETNHVYVCDLKTHKLYRLNSSLESLELFDFKPATTALCFYRDKLYISHRSFVSVVRVL